MRVFVCLVAILLALLPVPGAAAPVAYAIAISTAYASANPFPNRIDFAFVEPDTGYLQIANIGESTFVGSVGTVAESVFAGDLSFSASGIVLAPGESISIAIPDDASDVGGFNGPAYFARPGVEIRLRGFVAQAGRSEAVDLLVADADIHSGVWRVAPSGLPTDSFVLQGGDPWGFDPGDAFELSQAQGHFIFQQAAPEPVGLAVLLPPLVLLTLVRRRA
ncbi:MAG: hypothetical protein WCI94_22590 [Rhodospirillales bacterium]